MADTDSLDDSIHFTRSLPVQWQALDSPLSEFQLAANDQANLVLLDGIAMLEEQPKVEEGSPMAADITRMDAKLDLMMSMLSRLMAHFEKFPAQQTVTLSAHYIAWHEADEMPSGGPNGTLDIYIHPTIITPLRVPVTLESGGRAAITGLGARVQNAWEKYLFRQHRREVAQSKNPG